MHKNHSGYFGEEFDTELEVFCPWIGGDLQVFDVNHDGYDDLICHTSTGIIQISESHIMKQHTGGVSGNQGVRGEQTTEGVRGEQTTEGVRGEQTTEGVRDKQTTEGVRGDKLQRVLEVNKLQRVSEVNKLRKVS